MARVASLIIGVVMLAAALPAHAQPGPDELLDKKIAVWRFDALGIDNEIVQRLETLFRMELDRLDKVPQPSRRAMPSQRTLDADEELTLDRLAHEIADPALRAALLRLGRAVVAAGPRPA